MRDCRNLMHMTWDCKCPVVFMPKKRKKAAAWKKLVCFEIVDRYIGAEEIPDLFLDSFA